MAEELHQTKQRLLDAAEELFVSRGFDEVSIRELAAAAGVNVAAVNYHFQGKDNLYREVIIRRFSTYRDRTLAEMQEVLDDAGGRPALDAVIRLLVSRYLTEALGNADRPGILGLVIQELHGNPTRSQGLFFKEMIAPMYDGFRRALLAARPGLQEVDWVIASIVGQIHHFLFRWHKSRALAPDSPSLQIMRRLFPALGLDSAEYIRQVTDHVTRFSTGAIDTLSPEVA